MADDRMNFLRSQFDKLFIGLLIIFFTFMAHHVHDEAKDVLSFCLDSSKQLVAALLTLTVQKAFQQRKTELNGGTNDTTKNSTSSSALPAPATGA